MLYPLLFVKFVQEFPLVFVFLGMFLAVIIWAAMNPTYGNKNEEFFYLGKVHHYPAKSKEEQGATTLFTMFLGYAIALPVTLTSNAFPHNFPGEAKFIVAIVMVIPATLFVTLLRIVGITASRWYWRRGLQKKFGPEY
jgi:hypothetical protein